VRKLFIFLAFAPLAACQWMGRQADALGEYMPTIGEPCEHWQCITPSGQRTSDAIKAEKERQEEEAKAPTPLVPPAPAQ